tara:strand:- start:1931 stop:4084 length:2154 start_codon:yes stop_codon:yes gene_type:complete
VPVYNIAVNLNFFHLKKPPFIIEMAENGILDYQGMNQAIYRGATSNIVVDTQSMSIEIGAGNSSHTSNLHIECDHDANVASIQLNSNVVTEFPRSKKLIKYPRVALTANSSGGYVAGRSTVYVNSAGLEAWKMFDGDSSTYWHSENSTGYWNTDGTYDGTSELVAGHLGEYVTLQLPTNEKVQLHSIRVFPRGLRGQNSGWSAGAAPKDVVVIGSNGGSSWDVIATTTLTNYSFGTNPSTSTPVGEEYVPATFDFEATEYYQYVGLIIKSLYSGGHVHASMTALEFLGLPEYDPEAHGTDVTVKSYPNVPNTDWLEVYYDAKNYTSGLVQDLSTNSFNGTLTNGASFNNSDGIDKFVFDGSNDYISGSIPSTFTGNQTYTFSIWVKPDSHPSGFIAVFGIGTDSTNDSIGLFFDSGNIIHLTYANNLATTTYATIGEWVHITGTYDGTGRTIFVNGKLIGTDSYSSLTLAGTTFRLGSNLSGGQNFNGSIANFRLFNRALTSDEIYQLYAYQKEDFGHSTNNMTLKAGRLGIGTSEPRAALDVRGTINATRFNTLVAEHTVTSTVDSVEINGLDLIGDGGTYKILWKVRNYGATNPQYYMTVNGDATTGNYYYGGKQHTNTQSLHDGNFPTIFRAGQDSTHTLEITMTRSCDGYIVAHGQGTFHTGNNLNAGSVQGWELNRWFYKIPGNVTSILFSSANPDTARYGSGSNIQIHKYM